MSAPPAPTRAPTALRGRAVEGLETVDAEDWDDLVQPGSVPLRHGFLTAWERSELPGLRSVPVLAYRGSGTRPVAACPGYYYDLDLVGTRFPAAASVMAQVRRVRPGLLMARTYELGNPTPLTNPMLVRPDEDRAEAVRVLIETALEDAARRSADFLLVQNVTSLSLPMADILRPAGFVGIPIPPTVVVDLPYDSFDAYLGAMRAQYRRRARQVIGRSEDLRVEHLCRFDHLAEELAGLWKMIYDRAKEMRREILTPAFFRDVSALEETSVLLLRRPNGSIASFALLLEEGSWLSFLQCGFDAEAGRREGAYFRLLYEIVRTAIEGGFAQLELGMTTLAPKLDIGGVPVRLYAFVHHRNPVLHRALRLYGERLVNDDELEPRRVFKDAPPTAQELVARRAL